MEEQTGFSLVEVLLSLMLTTTMVYFLLQLQGTNRSYLNQLFLHAQASAVLDEVEEELLVAQKIKVKKPPYTVYVQQNGNARQLDLSWFEQRHFLERHYQMLNYE